MKIPSYILILSIVLGIFIYNYPRPHRPVKPKPTELEILQKKFDKLLK